MIYHSWYTIGGVLNSQRVDDVGLRGSVGSVGVADGVMQLHLCLLHLLVAAL